MNTRENEPNTPIEKLMEQYAEEGCNFDSEAYLRAAALRYVSTMPDSQVRCLLYAFATAAPQGESHE